MNGKKGRECESEKGRENEGQERENGEGKVPKADPKTSFAKTLPKLATSSNPKTHPPPDTLVSAWQFVAQKRKRLVRDRETHNPPIIHPPCTKHNPHLTAFGLPAIAKITK